MTEVRVEGIDKILSNLNKEIARLDRVTLTGLKAAGAIIQAEAQRRVPVETGNLRASAYTRPDPEEELTVLVGFEAAYALFVHENLEQKLKGVERPSGLGVYWGPKGQPKFLEKALQDKAPDVLRIIAKYSRIKD